MSFTKVEDYAESYEFRFDNGGGHVPTEAERAMLVDFGHGLIAELEETNIRIAARTAATACEAAGYDGAAAIKALPELAQLVADAVEDETEFETEWNKAARELLSRIRKVG